MAHESSEDAAQLAIGVSIVVTALICGVGAAAYAEEAPSTESADAALEEIIVTAERREENLQQTPIAVSAFSTASLDAIGAKDFTAISGFVPNVNLMPTSGQNGSALNIRGIGSADSTSAIDPKVGLYIDGVYVARNTGTIFELDMERIEVLRGPQGTLWGKNTTGGSINVITARPSGQLGFTQDVGAGEYGYVRTRSVLDLPAFRLGESGNLSTRFTYLKTMSDGWARRTNIDVPGPHELGQLDSDSYRFAATWDPLKNLNVQYAFDHVVREGTARQDQLIGAIPALGVGAYLSRLERLNRFELNRVGDDTLRVNGHSLIVDWQLGNVVLKSITGYRKTALHYDPDLDGTPAQYTAVLLSTLRPYTGGLYNVFGDRTHKQFSQELQAMGTGADGHLNYTIGAYYFDESGMESTRASLYYNSYRAFVDTSKTFTIDNRSTAAYGQVTWAPPVLGGRLHLIAGARYTEDRKDVHKTIHEGRPADLRGKKTWSNFSPAGTIELAASDDVNLYLRIARGYNAGVFNVRSSKSFTTPAEEETLTSYELGMKSEWLDHRLRMNVATFLSRYSDMQQFPYVSGESTAVNVGDTDLWGVELEATARPTPALTLGLSYGYLKHDIKSFVYGGVDVANRATLAFAPKNTASAYVEYALPRASFGRFTLRLDGTYKDEVSFDALSFLKTRAPAYSLLNARITLAEIPTAKADVSLSLWGRNLTNKSYQIFGVDFGEFQTGTFGDPRAFGLDLHVRL